jgi:hypothetical protein
MEWGHPGQRSPSTVLKWRHLMNLLPRAYPNHMLQDCWQLPLLTQVRSLDEMMASQLVPLIPCSGDLQRNSQPITPGPQTC